MVDPTAAVVIAAAVGGSAGKMVEITWDSGRRWLSTYFKDHQERAIEAAEENALVFLNDLAQRVHALEEAGTNKERIEAALDDPDFAATLKTALIASARTSNPDKHEILGRAVAERLAAEPEGIVALASSLAIDAVPHLSPMHLGFLGAAALAYCVRPIAFPPQEVTPDKFQDWFVSWLKPYLAVCLEPGLHMSGVDYAHLISVSCLDYAIVGTRNLKDVMSPEDREKYVWDSEAFLTEDPLGVELRRLWEGGMNRVTLTSAGQLIGIYVLDKKTGKRTVIRW